MVQAGVCIPLCCWRDKQLLCLLRLKGRLLSWHCASKFSFSYSVCHSLQSAPSLWCLLQTSRLSWSGVWPQSHEWIGNIIRDCVHSSAGHWCGWLLWRRYCPPSVLIAVCKSESQESICRGGCRVAGHEFEVWLELQCRHWKQIM